MDATRLRAPRDRSFRARWSALLRAPIAMTTAAALALGGAVAVVAASPATAATGDVTGTVFRDFNGNGVRDTGHPARTGLANDTGLAGVVVTATDGRGSVVAQTTSQADGTYTLATALATGTPVRVEFSGWPAPYQPSGTAGAGATNGTSVQFVSAGDTAVDVGLNDPADYAQDAAPLLTAIQRAGTPNGSTQSAQAASLVGLPYAQNSTSSQPAGFPGRVTVATFSQTGAIGNVLYQPQTDTALVMATYKRQSGLGTLGLGGIYLVTDVMGADGTVQANRTVTPWLDASTLMNLGTVPSNAARGLGSPTTPTVDPDGFAQAGKVGFGGATLSQDGRTLYVVNLNDKKLYALDVSDLGTPPTSARSWDLGLGDGQRPWAVSVHQGRVYVGVADSGETAAGPQPGRSAAAAGLQAHVLSAPENDLGAFTEVLSAGLGYAKGDVYNNQLTPQSQRWNTWTDTWTWNGGRVAPSGGGWHIYPQPILSGFHFDEDGYLSLAFIDRTAIQGGNRNSAADPTVSGLYETGSSGDILIAAPRADGTFQLENNGAVGTRTTTAGKANEGPGGREFYDDSNAQGSGGHHEVGLGSLAGQPGTREVVATVYDPLNGIRLSGLDWLSVDNGRIRAGYELTTDGGGGASVDGGFQKGGGLGTVSLLARQAPVEIGNRVWFDADQDGIQDADEPAIQGVDVVLYAADGTTVIATTTTDASGEYYFRSDRDGFDPNGEYVVRFVPQPGGDLALRGPNADAFGDVSWASTSFTTTNSPGSTPTTGSDADATSGLASVVLHGPGMNDHTIDAGFIAERSVTVEKTVDAAGGTPAAGQTFTVDVAARDFRGDPLVLPQSSFELAAGGVTPEVTVPVGAQVRVTEDEPSMKTVAITDPTGAAHTGWYTVKGTGQAFGFRVANTLYKPGYIEVTKAVTGDFTLASPELADAEFTVAYSYAGGSGSVTLDKSDWKSTIGPVPYGAEVTLTETARTGQAPSVAFGTQTWSTGGQSDGTAKVTVGDGTTTAITLTNPTTTLVGGFAVTKDVTGAAADRVPSTTAFTVEFSTDGGATWAPLGPVFDGTAVDGPQDLPAGTTVLLREADRPDLTDVSWETPAFSGTGVTSNTDGTASLVITADTTAQVALQNPTTPRNGQFSLTKEVTGPGASLVSGTPDYTVQYTSPRGSGTLTVKDGQTTTSPQLPTGTVVTLTEAAPAAGTLPAGAAWGTPVLRVNGVPQANGTTITIGDGSVVAVTVENPTTVTPAVDIRKGDGDRAQETITHEAETVATGEAYAPGETRDIVIRVTNTGPEPLREVVVSDETLSGAAVTGLVWTAPDGTVLTPVAGDGATTTARWEQTFGAGTAEWKPGEVIVGTATLTAASTGADAHQNRATVTATGALSGTPVTADNDYNAFVGGIQVIKYDGQKDDPAVKDSSGAWTVPAKPLLDPAQDANTPETAVTYPVDTPRPVRWVVTNTGTTWLTDITLTDTTLDGPAIGADWTADLSGVGGPAQYSFAQSGPWTGTLAPGASFFASGTLALPASDTHADRVDVVGTVVVPASDADGVPTDQPSLVDGVPQTAEKPDGSPYTVDDDDPFHAETGVGPIVEIRKGDGTGTTIAHEADTAPAAEAYQPGETRTVVFRVTNTGDEPLVDVVLSDVTLSGASVQSLQWTLPNGAALPAAYDEATQTWSATWAGPWAPDEVVTGSALLTLGAASAVHVDRAGVDAKGQASGKPVSSRNDYHAFSGGIQVIKYDGEKADPAVTDASGGWITPSKPLADADQDANDADHAVEYPVKTPKKVRWVVTNTGSTWLTDVTLTDTTLTGPSIGDDWTADLTPVGGPADYSFAEDGPWRGALAPGASFFAEGTLTLDAEQRHADRVDVVGTVVVPEAGEDGVTPTGQPSRTPDGELVRATVPDSADPSQRVPFTVDDDDPFTAWTGVGPYVDIEKGDGSGTTIVHDADTMDDAAQYAAGESRTVVFRVQNTGDEDLVDVELHDDTFSGAVVESLTWTLPDGSTLVAQQDDGAWVARWEQTFSGGAVWKPGEVITGTATLAVGSAEPHVDRATVVARGAGSGIPVTDEDDYTAFTSGIQVIKYDGTKKDPAVKDAAGAWITPAKPLVDAAQDADTRGTAVSYTADQPGTVRWVVTNTGSTWLTAVDLRDVTDQGAQVSSWTADLSAFGGPAAYDFVSQGTWHGLIPPGASFFAQGTLTMGAGQTHADTVTVEATPVVPATDAGGVPTGQPKIDDAGVPVAVTDATGAPVRLSDSDPFWAVTPTPLAITGLVSPVGIMTAAALLFLLSGAFLWASRRRSRTA